MLLRSVRLITFSPGDGLIRTMKPTRVPTVCPKVRRSVSWYALNPR